MQKTHFAQFDDKPAFNSIHVVPVPDTEANGESEMLDRLKSLDQRDPKVFEDLWGQHQNYLYHCCLRWMGGHHADAKDALNRAAFKVWEKLPQCTQTIANFRAWLIQLTHNLCVDIHREHHGAAIHFESLENIAQVNEEILASELYSPETLINYEEIETLTYRVIETLPPKLHDPFALFYYQEMSYQDIAQQLFLSDENVRKRIQQARQILQKRLSEYFSEQNNTAFLEAPSPCPEQSITSGLKVPTADEFIAQSIDYKVTATCLEPLSYAWYQ